MSGVPELLSKFYGETEQNLLALFKRADESPAVIFFDETRHCVQFDRYHRNNFIKTMVISSKYVKNEIEFHTYCQHSNYITFYVCTETIFITLARILCTAAL